MSTYIGFCFFVFIFIFAYMYVGENSITIRDLIKIIILSILGPLLFIYILVQFIFIFLNSTNCKFLNKRIL
jgi:hypothetical protein